MDRGGSVIVSEYAKVVARGVSSVNTAAISHVAAAVSDPVGVDQLPIPTGFRHADAVLVARHRREVAEADDGPVACCLPFEGRR